MFHLFIYNATILVLNKLKKSGVTAVDLLNTLSNILHSNIPGNSKVLKKYVTQM